MDYDDYYVCQEMVGKFLTALDRLGLTSTSTKDPNYICTDECTDLLSGWL